MNNWVAGPGESYDDTRRKAGAFQDNLGICAFYMHPRCTLVEKDRGLDGIRLEALHAWRELDRQRWTEKPPPTPIPSGGLTAEEHAHAVAEQKRLLQEEAPGR